MSLGRGQREVQVNRRTFLYFALFLVLASVPHTPEGDAENRAEVNAARNNVTFTCSAREQAKVGTSPKPAAGRAVATEVCQVPPCVFLCLHNLQNIFLHILAHVLLHH